MGGHQGSIVSSDFREYNLFFLTVTNGDKAQYYLQGQPDPGTEKTCPTGGA